MGRHAALALYIVILMASLLPACGRESSPLASDDGGVVEADVTEGVTYKATVSGALAGKSATHESAGDFTWNSAAVTRIVLADGATSVTGSAASVIGDVVTIASGGAFSLSGTLADGRIIVDAEGKTVRLILEGMDVRCSGGAPLFVRNADKVIVILAGNSDNHLADGASYVFENPGDDEPNAALFSTADLSIGGDGALTVRGNYNDGIGGKDGVVIDGGSITVDAADDGIRGKDYLIVRDGAITVRSGGDGLKSDNDGDGRLGYVLIESGDISVTSGGDAITAATDVLVRDGDFHLTSGGGGEGRIAESESAKGIKGAAATIIEDGRFVISSADDALHSNACLSVNGGTFEISSGDDAIHADTTLGINGGDIAITKSYEGIESRSVIAISGGDVHIVSSDDGINIASGTGGFPGWGGGGGAAPGNRYLYINGGSVAVNAAGDGMDINGSVVMTGGSLIISGPTSSANGALDYDASFKMAGGFLAAAGSAGMAQAPGSSSTQYSVLVYFRSIQQAGSIVHIRSGAGGEVLTFAPDKPYGALAFSSSALTKGTAYDVYTGGSSTGVIEDGVYRGGSYTPGTKYASFTVSGMVTMVNR